MFPRSAQARTLLLLARAARQHNAGYREVGGLILTREIPPLHYIPDSVVMCDYFIRTEWLMRQWGVLRLPTTIEKSTCFNQY
jgi:hypothetical protein